MLRREDVWSEILREAESTHLSRARDLHGKTFVAEAGWYQSDWKRSGKSPAAPSSARRGQKERLQSSWSSRISVWKGEVKIDVYGADWWAGEWAGVRLELGEGIELIELGELGKARKSAAVGNRWEVLQQEPELLCSVNWREQGEMPWGKSGREVERESTEQMHLFSIGKGSVGGEWSCLKLAWRFLCFVAGLIILEGGRSWRRNLIYRVLLGLGISFIALF